MKTMEKVLDYHIEGHRTKELHPQQHAYRKGYSTETALHQLVSRVEEAYYGGKYGLAIFSDIEGAFNKAQFNALEEAMTKFEVNEGIKRWIMKMLYYRKAKTRIKGYEREREVERGCPQGGVLSPKMWNMLINELLEEVNRKHPQAHVQAFADDVTLLLVGLDPGILRDIAQQLLKLMDRWCKRKGLTINPVKTEAIMFTKKRKWRMEALELNGVRIPLKREVKYLGVIIDDKLTWGAHCTKKMRTCANVMLSCRRAVGRTWGLKPKVMRWIYTAIVRPMISYGALVWLPAIIRQGRVKQLEQIQRMGCCMITSAFRTTPTVALEKLLGLLPMDIYVATVALEQMSRMKQNGLWRRRAVKYGGSHVELCENIGKAVKELALPCDLIMSTDIGWRKFKAYIEGKEEALKRANNVENKEGIQLFTDGSRIEERAGLGLVILENGNEIARRSMALGSYTTVNQAELLAIKGGADILLREDTIGKKIEIYSDSQASVLALVQGETKSALTKECFEALNKLARGRTVTLRWVPGHVGIEGNEVADKLAKEGAGIGFIGMEPCVPVSRMVIKGKIREWGWKSFHKRWRNLNTCRQAREGIREQTEGDLRSLLQLSRKELRNVIVILTGHGNLGRHLHKMGLVDTPRCQKCQGEEETPGHHVGRCPAYSRRRMTNLGRHMLEDQEWRQMKYWKISNFLKDSGRLNEISTATTAR